MNSKEYSERTITSGLHLTLGETIMILRRRKGLEHQDLALEAGVGEGVIFAIENGLWDQVKLNDMISVACAMGFYLHTHLSKEPIKLLVPRLTNEQEQQVNDELE